MEFDSENPKKVKDDPKAPARRPRGMAFFLVMIFVVVLFLLYGTKITGSDQVYEVNFKVYEEQLDKKFVEEIWIRDRTVEARLNTPYKPTLEQGGVKSYPRIRAEIPSQFDETPASFDRLSKGIAAEKVHNTGPSLWPALLVNFLPWIVLILLAWWFFMRQLRASGGPGNVLSFGRSRAKFVQQDKIRVTFDDVAGIDEAKEDVHEIIEFLKDPTKFTRLGGRIPRGVLLVGAPGCGKTLLAKAIAGEAGVPFLSITGSDFVEMFVGVGAARVRDLFNTAKEKSPCIVFIDEIDAVGRRRGTGLGGGHDEREQTLNQILVEMDGFETDEGVIVIAATNRPDVLDPALLRPGRFDREVVIDLPDVKGREEIFKVHTKKVKLSRNVDLKVIARATPMFSGADIANLVNEAAIIATMKRKDSVDLTDLEDARDKVLWGRQKKSREVIEEEKKLAAYHEAGHTMVSIQMAPHTDPVHKVTIIPRGRMGGATMFLPDKDRHALTKLRALAQLAVAMGGRAAEEIFLHDVSTGASNDFKHATQIARSMVTEWGLSEKMGNVTYADNEEHMFLGREIARTTNVADDTLREIDAEVRRFLDEALNQARAIINQHKDRTEALAKALIKYETITGDEVTLIFRGEDFETAKDRQLREDKDREVQHQAEDKRREAPGGGWKPATGPQQLPGPSEA